MLRSMTEHQRTAEARTADAFAGVMHVYTGNRYGGIERLLATMARSGLFASQTYVLTSRGRLFEELTAAGADVVEIGPFRARHPWQAMLVRRRLRDELAKRDVHTVVTHLAIPHALAAPVVGRRTLVYYAHEFHHGTHWSERWAKLNRAPDAVITGSVFDATSMSALFPGIPPTVVYYATELPPRGSHTERDAVRRELDTPLDHHVIVMPARLSPYKGHELLIDGLHALAARSDWTAWIAGGPQDAEEVKYEAALRARAERLGIAQRIRFLGERRDVARLLAAADLHCQPNIGPEPFGLCFIEALWAGLPVVTSAIGGALEIVTPELGELVPPGDATALAAALARCMDDPRKRRAAEKDGPRRAEELCSARAFAARLAPALEQARAVFAKAS
jgi:glycosyltransferase involved in cell wall biosynthesis